ncbi:HTTM domain-containing protein [Natrarchaeobius halalkaliphilus]|uniref:HTTM domain-containing protein n=1 Tax=Natrarchaeobius halalkaliphilus TaxID=1679091 RepID=A0A3N6MA71_9EURY|nr:HTTM domain-containing protein [Natrarchaeobius halalkaliphilus]RQG93210.1 HTTM domain-containing protein [Natrarchaeobius halalkaliphilus]
MTPEFSARGAALLARLRGGLEDRVRVDTRTLAVFRVFVGLLIVADVLLRSRNFSYFYTETGAVPRSLAHTLSSDGAFSFYHYTTDPTVIAALFAIQILIAIQLIVGYKTRLATVLSFLFVISLDHHNPLVTSYADILFRLLLFWAIFLPIGERWSIDAVHSDRQPRTNVASMASALILFQMVYMYFHNGVHKIESDLWTGGEATPKILSLDDMTFLLAEPLREFPTLLQLGGLKWYYMLLFSWLLLLLVGRKRMLFALLFVGGHAAFAVTVRIGAFPYVAWAGLLPFFQTQVWEDGKRLLRYAGLEPSRITARLSRLERVADYFPRLRANSERHLEIRRAVFDVSLAVVAASMVVFLLFAHAPMGAVVGDDVNPDQQIDDVASIVSADQPDWTIFAPHPRTTDRYYVFPAKTADGDLIDVYNHRPMTYDRPYDQLQNQYGTYRERFYMNTIRRGGSSAGNNAPDVLAGHLCDTWEEEYGIELTHIDMYHVDEDITMETLTAHEDRETDVHLIQRNTCGDHEPEEIAPPPEEIR